MIVRRRISASPRGTAPAQDPCALLAAAQGQLNLMLTGQLPREIETPQLGRVAFSQMTVGDLQRYIDQLTIQCNAQNGTPGGGRVPFSFEAWP